jgi:hypothetical protein
MIEDRLLTVIKSGLDESASIERTGDLVRAKTHCMYPSNGLVEVTIRGGENTIVASDEGGAFGEALSAGIPVRDYDRALAARVKEQGLILKEGIYTPKMPIEAAPLAVLLVANAAQEIARWLYEHAQIKRTRDFRAMLVAFLESKFDNRIMHDAIVVGHSNKPHKFANVVCLTGDRKLIVDPVSNDASSINARVVANLDVKAVEDSRIIQRIVYDDQESWTAADLSLLTVGAPAVAFSRVPMVIDKLAA